MADVLKTTTPLNPMSQSGYEDLEEQLDLAEVRCGTLRGQLDYMKAFYSKGSPCLQRPSRSRSPSRNPWAQSVERGPSSAAGSARDRSPVVGLISRGLADQAGSTWLPMAASLGAPPSSPLAFLDGKAPPSTTCVGSHQQPAFTNSIAEILGTRPTSGPTTTWQPQSRAAPLGRGSEPICCLVGPGLRSPGPSTGLGSDLHSGLLPYQPRPSAPPQARCTPLTASLRRPDGLARTEQCLEQCRATDIGPFSFSLPAWPGPGVGGALMDADAASTPSFPLRQRCMRAAQPRRSPPLLDLSARFPAEGVAQGALPAWPSGAPGQETAWPASPSHKPQRLRISPPVQDLNARLASLFACQARQNYQAVAEAEEALEADVAAGTRWQASLDLAVEAKVPAVTVTDLDGAINGRGAVWDFRLQPQVTSERPSSPAVARVVQDQVDTPAEAETVTSTPLKNMATVHDEQEEPWRQVLGLVRSLAEDVRRVASAAGQPCPADSGPRASRGRSPSSPRSQRSQRSAPSQCGAPAEVRVGGGTEDDLEDDAGAASDAASGAASSGGSVYEDPLGDTPRSSSQAEAGTLVALAPTLPAARELLAVDGSELFSNARFRADSPASSAASSNDAHTEAAEVATVLEWGRSPRWLHENQLQLPLLPLDLRVTPHVGGCGHHQRPHDEAAGSAGTRVPRSRRAERDHSCPRGRFATSPSSACSSSGSGVGSSPQRSEHSALLLCASRQRTYRKPSASPIVSSTSVSSRSRPENEAEADGRCNAWDRVEAAPRATPVDRGCDPWAGVSDTDPRHRDPPPAPPPSEMTNACTACSPCSAACSMACSPPPQQVPAMPQVQPKRSASLAPHYERPTTASQLKRRVGGYMSAVPVAGPTCKSGRAGRAGGAGRAAARVRPTTTPGPAPKHFPFVAATSTSRSHNLQLHLQAVLSQRKMSRPQSVPSASPADGEAILRPRTRPRASVAGAGLVPARCPLLGPRADLSDAASSCGGSDEAASSCTSSAADTVSMVEDAVDDSRLSEGRWEAEACGRRAELGGQRRCQCYPRHVTEYDHVLKPFLRGAVPTLESTACTAPSLGSAPARHNTPKQNVQPPPTAEGAVVQDQSAHPVSNLRAVVASLQKDLVTLGAARGREQLWVAPDSSPGSSSAQCTAGGGAGEEGGRVVPHRRLLPKGAAVAE